MTVPIKVETLQIDLGDTPEISVRTGSAGVLRVDFTASGGTTTWWLSEPGALALQTKLAAALRPRVIAGGKR